MHPDKMNEKENAVILLAECPQFRAVDGEKKADKERVLGEYEEVLKQLVSDHREQEYDFFVAFAPHDKFMELQRIVGRVEGFAQQGQDEGERILNSFSQLSEKYNKIIVINKVAGDVSSSLVRNALISLNENKIVLKKHHGQYSFIGMNLVGINRPFNLFENMQWGTESVLNDTMKILDLKMLSYELLREKEE